MAIKTSTIIQFLSICAPQFLRGLLAVSVNIFLIGDSNDRAIILDFCNIFRGNGSHYGGNDFVTYNKKWDSRDLWRKGGWNTPSFPKATVKNWSDLRCVVPCQNLCTNSSILKGPSACCPPGISLAIHFIHIFGSGDNINDYHLGICASKSINETGPYCATSQRINRAFGIVRSFYGEIDVIIFQSLLWDRLAIRPPNITTYENNLRDRLLQMRHLLGGNKACNVMRTVPVNPSAKRDDINRMTQYNNAIRSLSANMSIPLFDWAGQTIPPSAFPDTGQHPIPSFMINGFLEILHFLRSHCPIFSQLNMTGTPLIAKYP